MTTLTAGPNAILNLTGTVDKDDIFDLTSYSDGDVISVTYDVSDAVPTVVGGAAAATSYTDPAAAPVNNGETTEFGAVSLINFTISGVEYQAESGMTWYEWCQSEYNTYGFSCNNTNSAVLKLPATTVYFDSSCTSKPYGYDVILSGTNYIASMN